MMKKAFFLALTALLCATGANAQPKKSDVRVVVMDCYSNDDALVVRIDGIALALRSSADRNDSVGLCFDGFVQAGDDISVEVHSDRPAYIDTVKREDGKVLLISATQPAKQSNFVEPEKLLFD